jgi:hypothetical protein
VTQGMGILLFLLLALFSRMATSDISYTSYGCFAPDTAFTNFSPCITDAAGFVSYKAFCSQPVQNKHLESGIAFFSDPNCANQIGDASDKTTTVLTQCGFIDFTMLPGVSVKSQVSLNCSDTAGYYGVRTLAQKLTPSLATQFCFPGAGDFAGKSTKVVCASKTQYNASAYGSSNICASGEQPLASNIPNNAFISINGGANVLQASCASVPKTGKFLTAPNFPIGFLPQLTTTVVPTGARRKITVTTTRGQRVKFAAPLTAPAFAYAPSSDASNLLYKIPALSTIRITIGPTAPVAPVYLYAFKWPKGLYTWLAGNWTVKSSSKQSTIKPALKQIKVAAGATKTFSGILEFPAGTSVIRWKGNLTGTGTFVKFTLGYVVPKV